MPRLVNRYTTTLPLLSLVALLLALGGGSRPTSAHHLCGSTGSPLGAFDFQTYEAADYRNAYARAMELAGFNQLFPENGTFALPGVEGVQPSPYMPPVLLKSIAWLESGWAQASYDPPVQYGQVGPVLSSHDCGYGIMQITSGMQNVSGVPTLDQAMIGGHYAFNIARGARILADKWNAAPEFRPVVGSRDSRIIEDWYYALWGYNGFARQNHPLSHDPNRPPYLCDGTQPRSNYPYQELVFGCVAHPPVRGGVALWPAQEVHLPDPADPANGGLYGPGAWDAFNACSQNLQCSGMNIPTPNPWHEDPTPISMNRSQLFGDPVMSVSTGGLVFDAVPGGEALGQNVSIANAGSGLLAWRLTGSASWLKTTRLQGVSLGANLGTVTQTVNAYASAAGLGPGTYSGELIAESLWASGVPVRIPVTLRVSLQAGAAASGDISGDGKSDLLFFCCSDFLSSWIARGDGTFTTRTYRAWPGYAMQAGSWQMGYFNGDRNLDLVHFCCDDSINLWLSNGDGSFTVVPHLSPWPGYIARMGFWLTSDFNGDGRTDLAHMCCGDYGNIWLSDPGGGYNVSTLRAWPGYALQSGSWQAGDVNGDGKAELVHLCCADVINTWFLNADGRVGVVPYRPWWDYAVQAGSWGAGDFNGDRKVDLVHLCCTGVVNTWLSNGDGTYSVKSFQPWDGYGTGSGRWLGGDFNADGKTDLVHVCCPNYGLSWLSNGDGTYAIAKLEPWAGYNMQAGFWQAGDFAGDSRTDLLHVCCHFTNVWRAVGNGGFNVSMFQP